MRRRCRRDYPVDAGLARHLIDALIDREFDVAASDRHVRPARARATRSALSTRRIMKDPVVPVVPGTIHTYYPPNQPTPRRCYRLGQAIREAVENLSGRQAGRHHRLGRPLSHFVVDEALDRGFFDLLTAQKGRRGESQNLPREKLNSGSSEIRNWICAAGAVEHLVA